MIKTERICVGTDSEMYTYSTMSRNSWYMPPGDAYHNFQMVTSSSRDTADRNKVSRRTAEKRRRDRFSSYIRELETLVPIISRSARKMDKTSILRLSVTHLLMHQTLLNGRKFHADDFPKVDQNIIDQLLYEQMNGFLLIVTARGSIVFVSNTVEQLLGHLQTDLMGQSLYNITNPEDHDLLRANLNVENTITANWRKHFNVRLKRAGTRSEPPVYEIVNFRGLHKRGHASASSSNSDLLIFFIRLYTNELYTNRLIEATKSEYVTRHLLDGRIVDCDQRISIVAGYMSEEVSGLCAFNFMHRHDVRWVMIALRQMYDRGESTGSSCYRLLSKTGQFIYLRTFGYLEVDSSGIVESFVCVNTLVDKEEGENLIKELKNRYSAIIKSNEIIHTEEEFDVASVEDPLQLEAAVAHLVANLPSPGSENSSTPSPPCISFENQDCHYSTENSSYSHSSSVALKINKQVSKRPPNNVYELHVHNKRQKAESSNLSISTPYHQMPGVSPNAKVESSVYKQKLSSNNVRSSHAETLKSTYPY